MNKPKISIIIPVYNVEKYIEKCLNSLVNQDYGIENLEIIIIDDCSQDESLEIAQNFQKKYPKSFKIIKHKVNKKAGGARNTGLRSATGEFISFIDPDDFIDKETYAYLIPKMIETNADMCAFGFLYVSENAKTKKPNHASFKLFKEEKIITHKELLEKYTEFLYSMGVCNKVYKKHLLNGIEKFKEFQLLTEDAKFSMDTFLKSEKIFLSDKYFYFYRKNDSHSSATSKNYTLKESYSIRFEYHTYLDKLKLKYKSLISTINEMHVRYLFRFIHNILTKQIKFSKEEEKKFYKTWKQIYKNIKLSQIKNTLFLHKILFICMKLSFNLLSLKILYLFIYKTLKTLKYEQK